MLELLFEFKPPPMAPFSSPAPKPPNPAGRLPPLATVEPAPAPPPPPIFGTDIPAEPAPCCGGFIAVPEALFEGSPPSEIFGALPPGPIPRPSMTPAGGPPAGGCDPIAPSAGPLEALTGAGVGVEGVLVAPPAAAGGVVGGVLFDAVPPPQPNSIVSDARIATKALRRHGTRRSMLMHLDSLAFVSLARLPLRRVLEMELLMGYPDPLVTKTLQPANEQYGIMPQWRPADSTPSPKNPPAPSPPPRPQAPPLPFPLSICGMRHDAPFPNIPNKSPSSSRSDSNAFLLSTRLEPTILRLAGPGYSPARCALEPHRNPLSHPICVDGLLSATARGGSTATARTAWSPEVSRRGPSRDDGPGWLSRGIGRFRTGSAQSGRHGL